MSRPIVTIVTGILAVSVARAEVNNLKIVTDASPDYTDLPSLVHSVTSKWETPEEKCWAMFYWNHVARRQTNPMMVHRLALTDPIRQFNDYGFTMCSTISGINCAIWDAMGLRRYWHQQSHRAGSRIRRPLALYDNNMSTLYTLCDGGRSGCRRHRQNARVRGERRKIRARAHRQVSLPERDFAEWFPDRRGHGAEP
jgi:hypothetical protein